MRRSPSAPLVVVVAGASLVSGCAEAASPWEKVVRAEEFSIVVTREDGSTLEFEGYDVTCEPNFFVGTLPRGGMIEVSAPFEDIDPRTTPYFAIHAAIADVEDGATYEFGEHVGFAYDDSSPSGVSLFIADVVAEEPYFFVIDHERSKGTITVESATCVPAPTIELELSGTLAHEHGLEPSIDVVGRLQMED